VTRSSKAPGFINSLKAPGFKPLRTLHVIFCFQSLLSNATLCRYATGNAQWDAPKELRAGAVGPLQLVLGGAVQVEFS
jgi:hypothetical protein